jgi:hypothetical protein
MKNPIDTIGNRTRDLPACSTVPHPTADAHVGLANTKLPVAYHVLPVVNEILCASKYLKCGRQISTLPVHYLSLFLVKMS